MKVTSRERDTGWKDFQALVKSIKKDAHRIKVGVLDDGGAGSEVRDGGYSNAEIAAIHEFGSADGRIPERSFIRSTFEANREKYQANLKTLLRQVLDGKQTIPNAFNLIGARIAADIKKRVTTGAPIPPPNAPAVAARKARLGKNGGVVRTLVDTGRMIASVTWAYLKGSQ